MEVAGSGRRKILIVGEAPGKEEDREGQPFVGDSGRLLMKLCRSLGIHFRDDCWRYNAVNCRPPNNRTPTKEIDYCRPKVVKAIKELKPRVIVLLGKSAVQSVIAPEWKSELGTLERWTGWQIPSRKWNAWICPTYHPAWLIRQKNEVADKIVRRHLKAVFRLRSRPWQIVPDYTKKVEIELDVTKAATAIREFRNKIEPVAFDYETNRLKPDHENARIVSCSISDGKRTIAYPWHGEAIPATKGVLSFRIPKIAANLKFEDRWTRALLDINVEHWYWDTMLAAHVLDNRAYVTGLKFQSFVRFGQGDYDSHVKPYLQAGPDGTNRIDEIPIEDLLLYNGLDSLLEYKIAMQQMKEMEHAAPNDVEEVDS